ncbi:hypothetical protein B0H11DRAFT_2421163 [Mycena galericulata]|nr:hypothetical protein B0H11DRAFT_2421163 [Mycena galericulata]
MARNVKGLCRRMDFAPALPDLTVLIDGRDEPRVVFDTKPLLAAAYSSSYASTSYNAPPLTRIKLPPTLGNRPHNLTAHSRTQPPSLDRPALDRRVLFNAAGVWGLQFTTGLVPVLSMVKIVDVESLALGSQAGGLGLGGGQAGGGGSGGHACFADLGRFHNANANDAPPQFYYRDSWWADKFEYPENVPWTEKRGVVYLLDVDGNTFSGRYLGLLRSGGLVFKSPAFTEFFTPWLVPYEHFIPVRPDLADLPAKIEWARANDEERHVYLSKSRDAITRDLSFLLVTLIISGAAVLASQIFTACLPRFPWILAIIPFFKDLWAQAELDQRDVVKTRRDSLSV